MVGYQEVKYRMVVSWLNVAVTAFLVIALFSAGGTAAWYLLRANGGVFIATFLWSFLASFLWVGIVVETEPALAALIPHAFNVHLFAGCVMAGSFAGFGSQYGEGLTLGFTALGAVLVVLVHMYLFPLILGWVYTSLLVVV
jgi:hypothetical protein